MGFYQWQFVLLLFFISFFYRPLQRRLGDAAKKAIGKLTTRTVKRGDKVRLHIH